MKLDIATLRDVVDSMNANKSVITDRLAECVILAYLEALEAGGKAKRAVAYRFSADRPDEWVADTEAYEDDETFPALIIRMEE